MGTANKALIFSARKDNTTRAENRTNPVPIPSAEQNWQLKELAYVHNE